MNFPIQDMPQNPIDKGVNRSFDLYSKLLQALAAPEIMKSEQAQRKANLEKSNILNQFLPQQQRSEINLRTAQAPYYDAQTAEAKERTREMPDELTIKEQNLYGDAQKTALSNSRFNNTIYKLGNFLKTDIGKSLYVNDKQFADAATRTMRGLATGDDLDFVGSKIGSAGSTGGIPASLIPAFQKLIGMSQGTSGQPSPMGMPSPQNWGQQPPQPMGNPQQPQSQPQSQQPPQQAPVNPMAISPQQAQALQGSPQAAALGISSPQQQQSPVAVSPTPKIEPLKISNPYLQPTADTINQTLQGSGLSPDAVKKIQTNLSDMLEKKSTTTGILEQRQYAGIFNDLFKKAQPYLKSVYTYSGIGGRSKLIFDKALATMGITNPDLKNYVNFESVVKPGMAAELRKKLKGQATDQETKQMMDIIDPSNQWFYNKEIAESRMGALKDFSDIADINLAKGTTETRQSLLERNNPNDSSAPKQVSSGDIPEFASKKEFQAWFAQASPEMKAEAKRRAEARRQGGQ